MERRRRHLPLLLLLALGACGKPEDLAHPRPSGPELKPLPVETYPVRQILVALGPAPAWPDVPRKTLDEARERAKAAYDRLKAGEDFGKVAREYSDDRLSRDDDGFVGFVARHLGDREDLVRIVAALPEGAITEPVETESGFFILQRLSRAEGLETEARVAVSLEGFLVQWYELVPSLPASQTREQAYAEAARAVTDLRAGRTTEEAAMGRILGARAVSLGLRRHNLVGYEKAAEAFLSVPEGAWGDPVETKDGWLVARRQPYERYPMSHLLVTHRQSPGRFKNPSRSEPEAVRRAEEALERLRKDPASWDAVVRQYSDDQDTKEWAGRLGDICNVEPPGRRLPPEIEAEARGLKPGEISGVIPGRLGVHILRREP